MGIKRIVGIDFGTSSTYIKVKHYEGDEPVNKDRINAQYVDFNGNAWVPSIIQSLGDDFWFGYEAQTKKADNAVIFRNFKMILEHDDEETRKYARYLTELFFAYLFRIYQDQFMYSNDKYDEVETILSYPVKWKKETIQFLAHTAKNAGFQNVKTMDEPTAALSAILVQNTAGILKAAYKPFYIMMVDMGAGTTDLAILKCSVEKYSDGSSFDSSQVVSTWPRGNDELCFGGREVDEKLFAYLQNYLSSMPKVTKNMAHNLLIQQMDNIKIWKENTVSSSLNKDVEVSACQFLTPVVPLITEDPVPFPRFGRKQFEKEFSSYLESFVDLINGCTDDGKKNINKFMGMEDIEFVILTGGHSQWYFVRDILDGTIRTVGNKAIPPMIDDKNRIISLPRPQETVSLGLVLSPMKLELWGEKEPVIEFEDVYDDHSFAEFDRMIFRVDKKGQDMPLHLKWIEIKNHERPDSLVCIINKKYNLKLESCYYGCFCRQFMIVDSWFGGKSRLFRINLDVPYPNPELIYETDRYISNVSEYRGVLNFFESDLDSDKKYLMQMSLDGKKKKFLFEMSNIERSLGEKINTTIRYTDERNIYILSSCYRDGRTRDHIIQLRYDRKSEIFTIIDEVKHESCINRRYDNFYLQGNNIYYSNAADGIYKINYETMEKKCLLKGKFQLWGVNEKDIIFSDDVLESYANLYRMDLDGFSKKLIVNKIIDRSSVAGDWVFFRSNVGVGGIKGALIERYLVSSTGKPHCVKTDGSCLFKLL
ncbi:MAG: DUF5050 domain-containing protein [Sedimentibacter sp.]|uniref:DUF5050 domain-containing protein n=1 Tax=Sedimentibacter sp. TaxID=1960295 RepID=UPI0031589882